MTSQAKLPGGWRINSEAPIVKPKVCVSSYWQEEAGSFDEMKSWL